MNRDVLQLLEELDLKLQQHREASLETRHILSEFISGTVLSQVILIQLLQANGVIQQEQILQTLEVAHKSLLKSGNNPGIAHIVNELIRTLSSFKSPTPNEEEMVRILNSYKPNKERPN